MEPTLRSTQVLQEEAEDIGLTGKEVAEYVREQQTLDREERSAWRDTQKRQTEDKRMQAQAEVELEKVRAEAEEKRRADELQAEEKKRADEIKLQIAKIEIEAAKEQATRTSGNSKKSNSNRLTSDGEAKHRAACCAQSNDGQIYIEVGKLNGRPVKVLRDTGCTGTLDRALIPDSIVILGISGSLQMVL